MAETKRVFLVDGSALLFRSFYALRKSRLTTPDGVSIGAVYQFLASLLKLVEENEPDLLAVFFDTPEPTFRHEAYARYKANRVEMPEELAEQIPILETILDGLRFVRVAVPGLEADDLLAAYAREAARRGWRAFIVTSDKDLMQVVGDSVFLYTLQKGGSGEIVDRNKVREKFGVAPEQVIEVQALWGDSVDNIPGVPKIGEKTAKELIIRFGSLENLYRNLDQISRPAIRKSLEEHRDQAYLSRKLAQVHADVELPLPLEEFRPPILEGETPAELLRRYGFNSLLKHIQHRQPQLRQEYRTVTTPRERDELLQKLRNSAEFSFDLETTSLKVLEAEIVGLSFATEPGEAWFLPAVPPGGQTDDATWLDQSLRMLKPLLEDPKRKKVAQNGKYDCHVLRNYEIRVQGFHFDTMIAAFLLNPSSRHLNLDALSLEYLNYTKVPTSDLLGKGKNQRSMRDVPLDKLSFYACEDADMTLRLKQLLEPRLKEAELTPLLVDIEMPLVEVLLDMEREGVKVDLEYLDILRIRHRKRLKILEQEIFEIAGQEFNIGSPKQLAFILFEKFRLPHGRKGKTGYSTDMSVLEKLAPLDPLPAKILEHRRLSKLLNTYIESYFQLVSPVTGKVHTSFHQTAAATGRLSSSDPNLQNIPIRTPEGQEIRRAFIASTPDRVLLDADYSQIELRMFAHLSGDENLLDAFRNGEDIHRATAAAVFQVHPGLVTAEMRNQAKVVNFGVIYGMSAHSLARELGTSRAVAQRFIDDYFRRFPRVREFIESTKETAREKGYVTTLFKRRRYLPELNSRNHNLREYAERAAVNTVVQGSAAELIKVAMINLHRLWKTHYPELRMILQVHDELVFDVPRSEAERLREVVRREMETAVSLQVPVVAETGLGDNWLEAH